MEREKVLLVIPPRVKLLLRDLFQLASWVTKGFDSPSPRIVKNRVLLRNGLENAIWVETGTYRGDTTKFLARNSRKVFTIEPSKFYYNLSSKRLRKYGS